jgi:hypothetical protein
MSQEAHIQDTITKVRSWLSDLLPSYEVGTLGNETSFRSGSARVFISVVPWGDDGSVVMLNSWVLLNVPRSPELFERLAFANQGHPFTSFYADENDDPKLVDIGCRASILGTFLDEAELKIAAVAMSADADRMDDELQAEFGGDKFHE